MQEQVTDLIRPSGGDLRWPLRRAAGQYRDAVAVIDGCRNVTYGELEGRVCALARGIDELGVTAGGRIGYLGFNSLEHIECLFGIPIAGRVIVELNFRLAVPELAFIADDCGIELLVVDPGLLDVARELRGRCSGLAGIVVTSGPGDRPDVAAGDRSEDGDGGRSPSDCIAYEQLLERGSAGPGPLASGSETVNALAHTSLDEDRLAAIFYTGGTTGPPKGVMLSHGNLLANARHNLIATGHTHTDCWLHACPMFHVAGIANVFASTWVGARQVTLPRFEVRALAAVITAERVTHTVLVPTMLGMLVEHLEAVPEQPDLSSLRHVQYAASPISADLQRRVLQRFDCDIAQFYGMTEAAPTVTHLTPDEHRLGMRGREPDARRLLSIGRPVVGVEAEVWDALGRAAPPEEIGELVVRGPNVMLGYWNRPEVTARSLRGGWYHTGDAACVDSDGYIYVVDRLKDMIVTGGENVYSIEVENALTEHPAVDQAAVFGIPSAQWGEAVHAVVTLADGHTVTEGELIAHCRTLIASFKIPRTIDIQAEPLPRSGAGKVLKNVLREPFWDGHDRRVG